MNINLFFDGRIFWDTLCVHDYVVPGIECMVGTVLSKIGYSASVDIGEPFNSFV